jgi:hypothetical protein
MDHEARVRWLLDQQLQRLNSILSALRIVVFMLLLVIISLG